MDRSARIQGRFGELAEDYLAKSSGLATLSTDASVKLASELRGFSASVRELAAEAKEALAECRALLRETLSKARFTYLPDDVAAVEAVFSAVQTRCPELVMHVLVEVIVECGPISGRLVLGTLERYGEPAFSPLLHAALYSVPELAEQAFLSLKHKRGRELTTADISLILERSIESGRRDLSRDMLIWAGTRNAGALIELFRSSDDKGKAAVAEVFSFLRSESLAEVAPDLIAALDSKEDSLRLLVARALGHMKVKEAAEKLAPLVLEDQGPRFSGVSDRAAWALGEIGVFSRPIIEALSQGLQCRPDVAVECFSALERCGSKEGRAALDGLRGLLQRRPLWLTRKGLNPERIQDLIDRFANEAG